MLNEYWYIACLTQDLKRKPLSVKILGKNLVIFRSQDGVLGALQDSCPHRRMALSKGVCTKNGIRCGYHGWEFGAKGLLSKIPACSSGEKAHVKIKAYRVKESQCFIWVYMGDNEPKAEPYQFPFYEEKGWHNWVMTRTFEGNAFHCCENYLDVPHTVYVHSGLFRNEKRNVLEYEVSSGENWVQAEFFNEKPLDSFLGRFIFNSDQSPQHIDRFILPYTTRVDYKYSDDHHFIVSTQCTPIDEFNTRTFTYMAHRIKYYGALIKPIYKLMSHFILDQDVKVIREQTKSMEASGLSSFIFHTTDVLALEIKKKIEGIPLSESIKKGSILV